MDGALSRGARAGTQAQRQQAPSLLSFEEVVKRYSSSSERVTALDGVSLTVHAGEMLAVQGPSGSGKTTLLLLAAAALHPDDGVVRFQEGDLTRLDERGLAELRLSHVGLIAQNPHLMARVSAVENAATKLLLGGQQLDRAHERAREWLGRVGLAAAAARTPEELSGGERQRVAIARALAAEPQLVLADEPTANLDGRRSREIVGLLREIAHQEGRAVLLVTHDSEAAAVADCVLSLRDGKIVAGDG